MFRDLKAFNQALLARQAWRLIQFPNTLSAHLLKAKYYPSGELHDTVLPPGGSPSWMGVVHGLELVKKGLIWRVCSGNSIWVWRDNWLPRESGLKISGMKERSRVRRVTNC